MNPTSSPAQPGEVTIPTATEAETLTATSASPAVENEPAAAAPAASAGELFVLKANGLREWTRADAVHRYDFRQSGFLTPSELRRIRLRHDQFVRSLAARLAMFLRAEFNVQLEKLQIVGYQKFVESLPSTTHITLFRADPLKGVGLLVVPPRLGLSLVDRLLGGSGSAGETDRELTEIESALIDQISTIVLGEWCLQWPEIRDLKPSLIGHETNSRFLQTASPDAAMLVLTMPAGFGERAEPLQLAFLYTTVEPLVRMLCPVGLPDENPAARAAQPKWNREFDDVPVPVTAEWRGLKLSANEVSRLKTGDVLMIDPRCAAQVHLRLNQIPKFIGRPGTRGGRWAIELSGHITK